MKGTPKIRDEFLLVGTALLVCIVGMTSLFLGELYGIHQMYILGAFGSVSVIAIFREDFRGHFKKPSFLLFFAMWMVAHGIIVVGLTQVPLLYWVPIIALELYVVSIIVDRVFGITSEEIRQRRGE